jgi:hypothetical protein
MDVSLAGCELVVSVGEQVAAERVAKLNQCGPEAALINLPPFQDLGLCHSLFAFYSTRALVSISRTEIESNKMLTTLPAAVVVGSKTRTKCK